MSMLECVILVLQWSPVYVSVDSDASNPIGLHIESLELFVKVNYNKYEVIVL